MKCNRRGGLRELTQLFNVGKEVTLSQKTVGRNIHSLGFHARRACKKPLISSKNRLKRLAYHKRLKLWSVNDWKDVIFSDESKFNLFHSDGLVKVWRQAHERYHPDCTANTIKGFGGSLMFWGCITFQKLGPLIEVNSTLNSENYISNILDPFLTFWRKFRRKKKVFTVPYIKKSRNLVWVKKGEKIDMAPAITEFKPYRKCMGDIIQKGKGKLSTKILGRITGEDNGRVEKIPNRNNSQIIQRTTNKSKRGQKNGRVRDEILRTN